MTTNNVEQQIFESFNKANHILIAMPYSLNGDSLGSALAYHSFFKKQGKSADLVSSAHDYASFSFLPGTDQIKREVAVSQNFIVSLRTSETPLGELSYEQQSDRLDIILKPKFGKYTEKDISIKGAKPPYDLILTLDTPSLEHLGELYEKNTDLFFETPIVNIDHHPNNEQYGEINLVDLTATSTSEIVAGLMESYEASLIDGDIATNLLIGIIVETNSFQHVKTTPRAFLKASSLVQNGARQQEIVRELYKTKNIPVLKLWGRALARLQEIPELGLAYSLVNASDLQKTQTGKDDLFLVMKELAGSLAGRKMILFLAEVAPREVAGYFYLHPNVRPQLITGVLGGQMINGYFGHFHRSGSDILQVEKDTIENLRKVKDQIMV